MFQLTQAIDEWVNGVQIRQCQSDAASAELKDHLWCEVEHLIDQGYSEKEAFTHATQRVGSAEMLTDEYEKNRTMKSRMCAVLTYGERDTGKMGTVLALMFAGAILLSAVVLRGQSDAFMVIMLMLIALWFISNQMLPAKAT